jgi:hypothetical protein
MAQSAARDPRVEDERLGRNLDRLRADALDDAAPAQAAELIASAIRIVADHAVEHERGDEVPKRRPAAILPLLSKPDRV